MTAAKGDDNFERLIANARSADRPALGQLLEMYRGCLALFSRIQIGKRLQGKLEPSDLVQETFLEAYRDFAQLRGESEGDLVSWLRRILATNLANQVRRYHGTRRRDLRLERQLSAEMDQLSRDLDRGPLARFCAVMKEGDRMTAVREPDTEQLLADAAAGDARGRNAWRQLSASRYNGVNQGKLFLTEWRIEDNHVPVNHADDQG